MNKNFKTLKKASALAISTSILLGISTPVYALEEKQKEKNTYKILNDNSYVLNTKKINQKSLKTPTTAPSAFQLPKIIGMALQIIQFQWICGMGLMVICGNFMKMVN